MRKSRFGFCAVLILSLPSAAACAAPADGSAHQYAQGIRRGAPADVGMSSEGLGRIGPAMQELIDEGRTGGIMTLVARRGTIVHWEANGWRVVDEDPLEPNDVFRIYSMTKPITSTAIMILVEEGQLELDQPLSEVVPAFADVEVYDEGELRAPSRQITIRDLLRHTSGLTYGAFGNSEVDQMYRAAGIGVASTLDLEETVAGIAAMPLLVDPGARWNYSVSTDVLGRVVEIVSGQTLDSFFQERIFDPLGMVDTGFQVPAEKLDRFTGVYSRRNDELVMSDSPTDGAFAKPPVWLSGGGGLTSTAMDYLRFSQMMLNEGELDGARILRPESVRAMRSNQLPDALIPIRLGGPIRNSGFGLGFAVTVEGDDEGLFWWAGIASTYFWIDPAEDIVAFAWTQYMPLGGVRIDPILRGIVYESLVERNRLVPVGTP